MTWPGASSESCAEEFENDDTASVVETADPTLTALEMQAGWLIDVLEPLLPEAITVAMPAARRLSIDVCSELPHAEVERPPPRLMFTEAMVWDIRSEYTCSRPA